MMFALETLWWIFHCSLLVSVLYDALCPNSGLWKHLCPWATPVGPWMCQMPLTHANPFPGQVRLLTPADLFTLQHCPTERNLVSHVTHAHLRVAAYHVSWGHSSCGCTDSVFACCATEGQFESKDV